MNVKPQILFLLVLLILNSCIAKFIPQIAEEKELLVVQGLITDQQDPDTIKLSWSMPLGEINSLRPVSGSRVDITDDLNNLASLNEITPGTYISPADFHGQVGRIYTLHVHTTGLSGNLNYESAAMEMKPVPPIDSIYYIKTVIQQSEGFDKGIDGCQIYLDTYDPQNKCKYYRWDFAETWEFRLPFAVPNQTCWIKEKSKAINIKSTVAFDESRITWFPINYITNLTDRLKTKYSILVNQYSLNEEEFAYWEKIQNVAVQVGGLYDIIPASVPSNINSIENPAEKVLGYFSVSAKSSKRIFIKDNFAGIIDHYNKCVTDTVSTTNFPGLNINSWIIIAHLCSIPCVPFFEITTHKECADCTLRGTNIKPDFWNDDK